VYSHNRIYIYTFLRREISSLDTSQWLSAVLYSYILIVIIYIYNWYTSLYTTKIYTNIYPSSSRYSIKPSKLNSSSFTRDLSISLSIYFLSRISPKRRLRKWVICWLHLQRKLLHSLSKILISNLKLFTRSLLIL